MSPVISLLTFLLIVSLLAVFAGIAIAVVIKLLKGGGLSLGNGSSADEAKLIQEMHRDLIQLDQRIDALETIIIKQTRAKTNDDE